LPGGGLSSSAAVLLCYIMALADVNEIELTELELIQLAFEAEHEYIFLNLDKLDQVCIDWDEVENEFKGYFSENGRPSVPVRRMVGLMLLKSLYNLWDEGTVTRWVESPYLQYFTGEYVFQIKPPIDPVDFSKFRRHVGEEGVEKILQLSIQFNADEMAINTEVMVDTTVQEKNTTFPTDVKLNCKIITKCHKVAKNENIVLRRSYTWELKGLNLKLRFKNHPKRKWEVQKAKRHMQIWYLTGHRTSETGSQNAMALSERRRG
jgi:hypothetical protein